MSPRYRDLGVTAAAVLLLLIGASCKPGREKPGQTGQVGASSPSDIVAAKEAMTRGMQEITLDSLTANHMGRPGIVIARTAGEKGRADVAPPPLGMVRRLGPVTAYQGEIISVSSDGLTLRAPYPTSGQYKVITIPRADIESVYMAK